MHSISLDPRVQRMDYFPQDEDEVVAPPRGEGITWEVFHQKKRGAQHTHVGIVHAPGYELALAFAREQYARRGKTTSLWVVKSSEIYATSADDEDSFATIEEKLHREPGSYKVRDKIEAYKREIA